MKITVMGLGYIGLPTAITLAEAGFEVCGFDVNRKTIVRLPRLSLFLTVLKNREQTVNLCIWMLKTASMEQKTPRLS